MRFDQIFKQIDELVKYLINNQISSRHFGVTAVPSKLWKKVDIIPQRKSAANRLRDVIALQISIEQSDV